MARPVHSQKAILRTWLAKMMVYMVTTSFPRWTGDGEGAFIFELSRALARKGVRVRVISMHTPGAATYERMDSNIEVFRPKYWWPDRLELLRTEGGGLPVTLRKHPWISIQIVPYIISQTAVVSRLIQRDDLIHAHWSLSAGVGLLTKFCRNTPIPLVATVHGSDIFQIKRYRILAIATAEILRRCDLVISVSKALAEEVVKLGVPQNIVRVIPNGVDIQKFSPLSPDQRENMILYVGSLIERKGVYFLINALPKVFISLPEYKLVIIGDGPQRNLLKNEIKRLGIESNVIFLGFQSHETVKNMMKKSKLLVLPSLEEAQGVVLLEAMACGTPVVATRVGGIPEIVTPDVGILVPPADSYALSDAILSALLNYKKWQNMSRNARIRIENSYNWNIISEDILSIYGELVDRRQTT